MQSNSRTIGVGIVVVAVAVALFFVFKGGSGDNSETTVTTGPAGKAEIPTIVVKNGKPVGGIRQLDYTKGDQIRFKVDSDVSDEVHVHGYDVHKEVKAGGSASFAFQADIEGVFEAELESRKEQIIELRVNP